MSVSDTGPSPPTEHQAGRTVARLPMASERVWTIDVLLVDDDEADTCLIVGALRADARVRAVHASSRPGETLFELAEGKLRPHLILLDINMPRLNGFKFLEALRRIPRMQATPVVFLTTSRLARDVTQALAGSVSSYVVKPDSYEELAAKLDGVVEAAIANSWSR
ncbi:MAG TPA: response regulator [Caulobacterales bacterium]|nr:response regulator [Caulobacterales bacterium]